MLSPASPPGVPGEVAQPLAQLRKLDSRRPGGLRIEAGSRHSREGIGLETKDVAIRAQPEVDPRVPAELERPMRREGERLQLAGELRVELGREGFFRHPGRVLALVVE